jgi:hypothetical protein
MKEDMAHPFSTRTEHTRGEIKILEDFIKTLTLHHASKTIKKIISKKMIDWLETIPNEKLRSDVKKNILVSGGCITSLFQGLPVNDYDVYIQDMDVLIRLAQHYYPGTTHTGVDKVLDGRKREDYLNNIQSF